MKRKLSFLFLLPLMFVACENVLPVDDADLSAMVAEFTTPTQTITYEGHVVDVDYFVSSADLATYLELQPNSPNGIKRPVKSVEAKGPNADVTLMYVVNYDKGWEIISADKRAQPVLAFSEGGEFSFETANPGEKIWLECLACDVLNLRTADKALQTRAAENNPNVGFWRGLERRKELLEMGEESMTRIDLPDSIDWPLVPRPDMPIIPLPDLPDYPEHGHWELTDTWVESVPVDTVNHMIETHWQQGYPWNKYCPVIEGETAVAGCVAIAGAQMLYYLHNETGYPQRALLNPSFYEAFPSYNDSTVWNIMGHKWESLLSVEELSAARLIRDVGEMIDMEYGTDKSRAQTSELPEKLFGPYGIWCTYSNYDWEEVESSLEDRMPIIVRAWGTQTTDFWGRIDYLNGHAFIIDGYIRYKRITTYEYSWFYDEEFAANNPIDRVLPRTEIIVGNPYIDYICMNWGWNDDNDDSWYYIGASPSSWHTEFKSNGVVIEEYNFDYERQMITGFTNIN